MYTEGKEQGEGNRGIFQYGYLLVYQQAMLPSVASITAILQGYPDIILASSLVPKLTYGMHVL